MSRLIGVDQQRIIERALRTWGQAPKIGAGAGPWAASRSAPAPPTVPPGSERYESPVIPLKRNEGTPFNIMLPDGMPVTEIATWSKGHMNKLRRDGDVFAYDFRPYRLRGIRFSGPEGTKNIEVGRLSGEKRTYSFDPLEAINGLTIFTNSVLGSVLMFEFDTTLGGHFTSSNYVTKWMKDADENGYQVKTGRMMTLRGGRWTAPEGNMTLRGFHGRESTDSEVGMIHGLGVHATLPTDVKYSFTNVVYDTSAVNPVNNKPEIIWSGQAFNDGAATITKTWKFEHSATSSSSWEIATGFTVGVAADVKAGLPGLVESKVTVSTEVRFDFTYGESHTEDFTDGAEIRVSIPPGEHVEVNASYTSSKIDVPFTADVVTTGSDGSTKIEYSVAGTYHGVLVGKIFVESHNIPRPRPNKPEPVFEEPPDPALSN